MNSVAALGAAATVVATAFALCTIDRWNRHRKAHELAWSISLVMFALASAAYWWGGAAGWSIGVFRVFYLFGAILNVPYLAAGTIHLLAPAPTAQRCKRGLDIVAALCAGVVLATPAKPVAGPLLPVGKEIFGVLPRVMAAVGSGVGATVLIGGAVWSAVRLIGARRSLGGAPTAAATRLRLTRLAITNTLIALGSLILGVGGALFTGPEAMTAFGIFLTLGISVMFAGFLVSSPRETSASSAEKVADEQGPADLSPFMQELWTTAREASGS